MKGSRGRQKSQPYVKPVQKIELSESHTGLRLVFFIIAVVVAAVALSIGVADLFSVPGGVQKLDVLSGSVGCGGDFSLFYDLGQGGNAAKKLKRDVEATYTDAASKAAVIFSGENDGQGNLGYVNAHPGETVTVDPALYKAFEQFEQSGGRLLYLGPIAETYQSLFYCTSDADAEKFDPLKDEAQGRFQTAVLAFAASDDHVRLQLLGENRVKLEVSEEYRQFAEENGVTSYLDFHCLRNAVIIDYLTERLESAGLHKGCLLSNDGYARVFGDGVELTSEIRAVGDLTAEPVGYAMFPAGHSFVTLRNYATAYSTEYCYTYADGEIRTRYLDEKLGVKAGCLDDLLGYSDSVGCTQIALNVLPCYTAQTLDKDAVDALSGDCVYCIYMDENAIVNTGNVEID